MTAVLQVCGALVEDLWRGSRIRCRLNSGCAPGRRSFILLRSISMELVNLAAHQRLVARGSPAPLVVDRGGWLLWRLRRWRVRPSGGCEVEDGGSNHRHPLFSLLACISLCTVYYSI